MPSSNSLRPGRPLKRSSYADFTDFHPMDFNMIGDEMVVEFVPKYDIWQLYRPKRILDIRR
uniref:Bm8912 n=1 Tax=Brugia malayi TaxID=6279 RepID=A0A0J9YAB2_BRUMA|nr:Bm8912 [Brugia malayi]